MTNPDILSYRDEKKLSSSDKKEYYKSLRDYCFEISKKNKSGISLGQKIISSLYMPSFYNSKLEIYGSENIPSNENVVFVCNHSNSHDIFSLYSIFSKVDISASVMVATDCLNPLSTTVFDIAGSTLFDRRSKEESKNSVLDMSSKILSGKSGAIFGEATWNLHPINPMHFIKVGAPRIALISDSVIVPMIMEYVENPSIYDKEIDLYNKIVIYFGKPIEINYEDSLEIQALKIQREMSRIRQEIWKNNGINRDSIDKIDPKLYVNHTYLKKFKAFGFQYDSEKESKFLYFPSGESVENEYHIDENGNFVPGITLKKHL